MVQPFEFALAVITISVSGVMSPGPLFAANVAYGLKGGAKSGLKMAYGHTVIELPLVVLLGIGAISLVSLPQFREVISLLGALSLFVFAALQIRKVLKQLGDPVKEFIQQDARADKLAEETLRILNDKDYNRQMRTQLAGLRDLLGAGGGSCNVAQLAYEMLKKK